MIDYQKLCIKHKPNAHNGRNILISEDELNELVQSFARNGYKCEHVEQVQAVEQYANGYNLLLSGGTGGGKTYFFSCKGITILDLPELVVKSKTLSDLYCELVKLDDKEIVIDDVGHEPNSCNYAPGTEAFPIVLNHRLTKQNARTHITTNFTGRDIEKRYKDSSLLDRIFANFKAFKFNWDSYRELHASDESVRQINEAHAMKNMTALEKDLSQPYMDIIHLKLEKATSSELERQRNEKIRTLSNQLRPKLVNHLIKIIPKLPSPEILSSELTDYHKAKKFYDENNASRPDYEDFDDYEQNIFKRLSKNLPSAPWRSRMVNLCQMLPDPEGINLLRILLELANKNPHNQTHSWSAQICA